MNETVEKLFGRRLDDRVHAVIFAVVVLGWPLSLYLVSRFYADIPEQLQKMREEYASDSARTQAALMRLAEITTSQTETLKLLIPLQERIALVEQEQRQQAVELTRHEKRLDKLEERPSLFGGGKK